MAEASAAEVSRLVESVVSAAKKAESGDPAERERAIDGLRALAKLALTTAVLGETAAGKRVRALMKHPEGDLAAAAGEVVKAWKDLVRRESLSASQQASEAEAAPPPSPSQPQPESQQPSESAAANSAPPEEEAGPSSAQPSQQANAPAAAALLADLPPTGSSVRDKCRANLVADLALAVGEGAEGFDPVAVGVAIESALSAAHSGVTPAYKAKFRQLHFNLGDARNPDLRRRVLEGGVPPEELIEMQPEELASDAKRQENQRIRERKLFDAAPSAAKQATTDQFQCGKCRQRKCTYYQMQTRSADEPMTTFVSCLNCNNRWKFC